MIAQAAERVFNAQEALFTLQTYAILDEILQLSVEMGFKKQEKIAMMGLMTELAVRQAVN